MRVLLWSVLALVCVGFLVLPYLSAQWETIHYVKIGRTRYFVTESLQTSDLEAPLNQPTQCDEIIRIDETYASLFAVVPSGEEAFLIKFCVPTSYRINGLPPDDGLIGVIGVSPLVGELTNSNDSKEIVEYNPTNGTYSAGDLLFRLERTQEGTISVRDGGIIFPNG